MTIGLVIVVIVMALYSIASAVFQLIEIAKEKSKFSFESYIEKSHREKTKYKPRRRETRAWQNRKRRRETAN